MDKDLYFSVTEPISEEFEYFKREYDRLFETDDPDLKPLLGQVRASRGKMMRPILMLLIAGYYRNFSSGIFRAANSLELLHTATLVHDDVVDNSFLRRGVPSVNSVFGNKLSVLLGDYLVSIALSEISATGVAENIECFSSLAKNLASGEISQLSVKSSSVLSEEDYFRIITNKTASLFSFCAKIASLTCGADSDGVCAFSEFGRLVGLCFQIRDDIFDYFNDESIGKPYGNDMSDGKITLPAIYALNNSAIDWSDAIRGIRNCSATADTIRNVTDFTLKNGGIEYAERVMKELGDKAVACLPADMDYAVRKAFTDYVSLVICRRR